MRILNDAVGSTVSDINRAPNGSRVSCGALKKKSSFNILRAASFKRLLGGTPSCGALSAGRPSTHTRRCPASDKMIHTTTRDPATRATAAPPSANPPSTLEGLGVKDLNAEPDARG